MFVSATSLLPHCREIFMLVIHVDTVKQPFVSFIWTSPIVLCSIVFDKIDKPLYIRTLEGIPSSRSLLACVATSRFLWVLLLSPRKLLPHHLMVCVHLWVVSAAESYRSYFWLFKLCNGVAHEWSVIVRFISIKTDGMKRIGVWERVRVSARRLLGNHETLPEDPASERDERNQTSEGTSNSRWVFSNLIVGSKGRWS